MTSKKPRVFATCHIGDAALDRLREKGYEVEVYPGPEAPPKALIVEKARSGIDGLITTLRDPIDAEVFEAGKGSLKVVAQIAVGFDNINRSDANPFLGDEVSGKTIAVIGTGRIGQALIKKCMGLEMNILCYDPAYQDQKFVAAVQQLMDVAHANGLHKEKRWIKYVGFEDALRQAEFVSLHVPLVREGEPGIPTYHLINETTLRLMRKDAYLINTSRGPVVDEAALYKALKERWIAGAALDVFEKEPLPPDSPLRDPDIADRCRLFHHFASGGRITRLSIDPDKGMAGRCVQGLLDVLECNYGGNISKMPYVVNQEAFL